MGLRDRTNQGRIDYPSIILDNIYREMKDGILKSILNSLEETNGLLIGKQSGGSFTTARGATDRVDCTLLPSFHPTLIVEDIEKITKIVAATGERIEYIPGDGTDGTYIMSVAGNNITVTGMTSAAADDFIVYTNIAIPASSSGTGAGGGNNTYSTEQKDITAVVESAGTNIKITYLNNILNINPFALNNFLNGILKVYDLSATENKTIKLDKPTWTAQTGLIYTIAINAGGTGYTTGSVVSINTGSSLATYTVTAAAGVVTALTLIQRGAGYTIATGVATTLVSGAGNNDLTVNITEITGGGILGVANCSDVFTLATGDTVSFTSISINKTFINTINASRVWKGIYDIIDDGRNKMSPLDFGATYTSVSSITLDGTQPTISNNAQIRLIVVEDTNGYSFMYINRVNGYKFTASGNVISVTRNGVATNIFASSDLTYHVLIRSSEKDAYDKGLNQLKTSVANFPVLDGNDNPANAAVLDTTQYYNYIIDLSQKYHFFTIGMLLTLVGVSTAAIKFWATNNPSATEPTTGAPGTDWRDITKDLFGVDTFNYVVGTNDKPFICDTLITFQKICFSVYYVQGTTSALTLYVNLAN